METFPRTAEKNMHDDWWSAASCFPCKSIRFFVQDEDVLHIYCNISVLTSL